MPDDDFLLQHAVLAELYWEPSVVAAHIGATTRAERLLKRHGLLPAQPMLRIFSMSFELGWIGQFRHDGNA
jgi:hypothetical protein